MHFFQLFQIPMENIYKEYADDTYTLKSSVIISILNNETYCLSRKILVERSMYFIKLP